MFILAWLGIIILCTLIPFSIRCVKRDVIFLFGLSTIAKNDNISIAKIVSMVNKKEANLTSIIGIGESFLFMFTMIILFD